MPPARRLAAASLVVLLAAGVAFVLAGPGFVNYDTLYGLLWGKELLDGARPGFRTALAPTPKPLLTVSAALLGQLGVDAAQRVTVLGAFLALGGLAAVCGSLTIRLAGWPAGVIAGALVLTRVPVLSFGARAYVDIPYALLVLGALNMELRRPRAGGPVLVLLALAGLLRPEAWLFAATYGIYCALRRDVRELVGIGALVLMAPALWLLHDWLLVGDPLWSLSGTRATAQLLDRPTGLAEAVRLTPRRLGEIVREPVLLAAALGGVLFVGHRRGDGRALLAGLVLTLLSFGLLASAGLPALGRYLILPAMLLLVLAAGGLVEALRKRGIWRLVGVSCVALFVVLAPGQVRRISSLHRTLGQQARIFSDLEQTAHARAVSASCRPLRVPNHRVVPLLALELDGGAAAIATQPGMGGTILLPISARVARLSLLDPREPGMPGVTLAPGGRTIAANRSWRVLSWC